MMRLQWSMFGPRVRTTLASATSALVVSISSNAYASLEPLSDNYIPRVVGGQASAACAWPTTVSLNSCTGTLVHPKLVIYAAHCGVDVPTVYFGETRKAPARKVPTEYCKKYPNGGTSGNDYAFCVLKTAVDDIPIVPPLMGEDVKRLQKEQMAWVVGFGLHSNESFEIGTQYEAEIPITGFTKNGNFVLAGRDGKDGCNGDSGGPLFYKLPNNRGFRVFGITSFGDSPCGTGGGWALMHKGMPWFEAESGFDLTPCHDAQGHRDPDPRCRNFPLDPGADGGSWSGDGCNWGPTTQENDHTPPTLEFISPKPEQELSLPLDIKVRAADNQELAVVQLYVNGEGPESRYEAPFEWTIRESTRTATKIKVVAKDWVGNQKIIEREVGINNPTPEDSSSGDLGTSTADNREDPNTSVMTLPGDNDDPNQETKDPPLMRPDRNGCSSTIPSKTPLMALWAFFAWGALIRRSRRTTKCR